PRPGGRGQPGCIPCFGVIDPRTPEPLLRSAPWHLPYRSVANEPVPLPVRATIVEDGFRDNTKFSLFLTDWRGEFGQRSRGVGAVSPLPLRERDRERGGREGESSSRASSPPAAPL